MKIDYQKLLKNLGYAGATALSGGIAPTGIMATAMLARSLKSSNDESPKNPGGGAMPTKTNNNPYMQEWKKNLESFFIDPKRHKEMIAQNKALSAESLRYSMNSNEMSLLRGSPSQLFGRVPELQSAVSIAQFQLLQIHTRYQISIAKALGVDTSNVMSAYNSKTSFLSTIVKMIEKIPGVSPVSKSIKHTLSILNFLNPLTWSNRLISGSQKVGNFFQKILLGKTGYNYLKDPKKVREDAGLNLSDGTKLVNLTKVLTEINLKQLNVLTNIKDTINSIAKVSGIQTKDRTLDYTFDEYNGKILSNDEKNKYASSRNQRLIEVYQKGMSGGLLGKISSIGTGAYVLGNVLSKGKKFNKYSINPNSSEANIREKIFIKTLYENGLFDSIYTGQEATKVNKILRSKPNIDIFSLKDNEIKDLLIIAEKMAKGGIRDPAKQKHYQKMYGYSKDISHRRAIDSTIARFSRKGSNFFSVLTGKSALDSQGMIGLNDALMRTGGNINTIKSQGGASELDYLTKSYKDTIFAKLQRAVPIIGGLRQMRKVADADTYFNRLISSAGDSTENNDEIWKENNNIISSSIVPTPYANLSSKFSSIHSQYVYEGTKRALLELVYEARSGKLESSIIKSSSENDDPNNLRRTAIEQLQYLDAIEEKQEEKEKQKEENAFRDQVIDKLTEIDTSIENIALPSGQQTDKKSGLLGLLMGLGGGLVTLTGSIFKKIFGDTIGNLFNIKDLLKNTFNNILESSIFKKISEFSFGKSIIEFGKNHAGNIKTWGSVGLVGLTAYNLYEMFNSEEEGKEVSTKDVVETSLLGAFFATPLLKKLTKIPFVNKAITGLQTKLPFTKFIGIGGILGTALSFVDDFAGSFDEKGNFSIIEFFKKALTSDGSISSNAMKWGTIGLTFGGIPGLIAGILGGSAIAWLFGKSQEAGKSVNDLNQSIIDKNKVLLTLDEQKNLDNLNNNDEKEYYIAKSLIKKAKAAGYDTSQMERNIVDPTTTDDPIRLQGNKFVIREYRNNILKKDQGAGSSPSELKYDKNAGSTPDMSFNTSVMTNAIQNYITSAFSSSGLSSINSDNNNSNNNILGSSSESIASTGINLDHGIGAVSSYFESGGNSQTVGYDSTGGTSYGRYQFSSKQGSLQEFLNYAKSNGGKIGNDFYNDMMQSVNGNTNGFNTGNKYGNPVNIWRKYMSNTDLQKLEQEFNLKTKYEPALKKLPHDLQKMISDSRGLQEMFFSTIMQHGPGSVGGKSGAIPIFMKAYSPGISPQEFVERVYNDRATRFSSSSANIQRSVKNRFIKEKSIILDIINGSFSKNRFNAANIQQSKLSGVYKGYPIPSKADLDSWKINDEKLFWPANSPIINSPMGPRAGDDIKMSRNHKGIDIKAGTGDPIYAAMGGVVNDVSNNFGTVTIQHPNGWITRYLHLNNFNVKPGDQVTAGDIIGGAGGTGKNGNTGAYAPHLHFEMAKNGMRVDPEGVYWASKNNVSGSYQPNQYASDIADNRKFSSKLNGQYNGITASPDTASGGDDQFASLNSQIRELNKNNNNKSNQQPIIIQQQTVPVPIPVQSEGATISETGKNSMSVGDEVVDKLINKFFNSVVAVANDMVISHTGAVTISGG